MDCPVCKKEFNEKTGRRPKKFCSDACKVKFWNGQKKQRQARLSILEPTHLYVPLNEHITITYKDIPNNDAIQKLIDEIKKEKIPDARNTLYGRKVWQKEQDQKIAELQKQLK